MSHGHCINLHSVRDSRGTLTVLQDVLPFGMRRIFWISGADGQTRGAHRHRATRMAMVAVAGTVRVSIDDGTQARTVLLDDPARCLLVEPEDWHTMHFERGAVLLVVASHPYDPADYIHEPYPHQVR